MVSLPYNTRKTERVAITVTNASFQPVPSFRQDIQPILTKSGCNAGGCHGKLVGQNGFRLSLRAFAPEWDYDWITREVNGRRVDFAFPDLVFVGFPETFSIAS